MSRPPMLMRVQIHGDGRRFSLWLPVFLLVPLALALLIILSPLILVAVLILRLKARRRPLLPIIGTTGGALSSVRTVWLVFRVLWSMTGLRIDVSNQSERIHISVI